ncbi:MAG: hypothetical protein ACI80V_001543 [Rhodothermales bacterium]
MNPYQLMLMATPSQALDYFREGVEARRFLPGFRKEYGKGMVQTTNPD